MQATLPPKLGKAILELAGVLGVWMLAPQGVWALTGVLPIQIVLFGPSQGLVGTIVVIVGLLLFFVTVLALWAILRFRFLSRQGVWLAIVWWALAFIPVLGVIGPILVSNNLVQTLRRYGVSTPGGRFPREQLQAIVYGRDKEELLENNP